MLRTHRWSRWWLVFFVFPCNGATVEWNWQKKTEVLGEKPVPVPLCPMTRDRTRASAVRGRWLTAWTMARLTPPLRIPLHVWLPAITGLHNVDRFLWDTRWGQRNSFIIETEYVLCEVRAAAEETVEHRISSMIVWERRVSMFKICPLQISLPRIPRLWTVYLLQRCGEIL
jgi:hypothetical protein